MSPVRPRRPRGRAGTAVQTPTAPPRWIDAEARPGKHPGGGCLWMGDGVSRISLKRTLPTRAVGSLAYEPGHTYHAHVLTAAGVNLLRLGEWLSGIPPAKTRRSPFVELMRSLPG